MQIKKAVCSLLVPLIFSVSSFSMAAVVDTVPSVLPVRLENFEVSLQNENEAQLTWLTAEQWTDVHYEIERSEDGTNFTTVGFVYPIPGPDPQKNFSFTDYLSETDLAKKQFYYRLKQAGPNYPLAYSPTRLLKLSGVDDDITGFFPNPCIGDFTLQLSVKKTTQITILFVNIRGNVEIRETLTMKGTKAISFPAVSRLKKGMYHVQVIFGNEKITSKQLLKL